MPLDISTARTNLRRTIFAGLGICAALLGLVGVLVPGLPGTVFVIAASHLFARSSPALDLWLRRNRWLGPTLQRLAANGSMSRGTKAFALASTWTELAIGWYALGTLGPVVQMFTIVFGVLATGTLLFLVCAPGGAARNTLPGRQPELNPL